MKRYNITVNGNTYDVAVEEVGAGAPVATSTPAPVATPVAAAPAPAAAPAVTGGTQVKAPMPGNIIAVKVAVGDSVSNGTVLAILEAMKMENDIVCPQDGIVAEIRVKKGDTVNSDDVIIVIK